MLPRFDEKGCLTRLSGPTRPATGAASSPSLHPSNSRPAVDDDE